jgi:hypothetical protein
VDAQQAVVVAGAVVTLTTLVKWMGMQDRYGPLAIIGLSLLGVGIWGYSKGPAWERGLLFDYFVGWLSVATSAAGVFGFTRSVPQAITAGSQRNSDVPGAGQHPTTNMSDVVEHRRTTDERRER